MTFTQPFQGYEILEKLGSGAMGTVFKARQNHMNRVVALKVLKPSLSRDGRFVERLRREGRIVGALNHPNIVTGYDLGEEGGYHFFVMEFVDGESLRDRLAEREVFETHEILDIAWQVTEALDHAFKRGVIHRDVKPGNILIDKGGKVKLTDMGLAKGATDLTLTRDGATVGTPQFISPEQARNPQAVDIRSDLYSLGATLFQMATGRAPFSGDTIGELITKVLNEPAPEAITVNPNVSPGLNLVIRKLLAKDPDLRYQDPAELLLDYERVRNDEQIDIDLARIERSDRRGRSWSLRLYGSAVAALLVGLSIWQLIPKADAAPTALALYRAKVEAALEAEADLHQRLKVQSRHRARAVGQDQLRVLDELDQVWIEPNLAELEIILVRFIRHYGDQSQTIIRPWLNEPANWSRQGAFFRLVVDAAMKDETGFRRDELPLGIQTRVLGEIDGLLRQVDEMSKVRDRQYQKAYADYLAHEMPPRLDLVLNRRDFEAARKALEVQVDVFHGSAGRPRLDQVADPLKGELNKLRREAHTAQQVRIADLEKRDASALAVAVREGLRPLRADLDRADVSVALVQTGLESLRRGLIDDYPPTASFSRDLDPWPAAERVLSGFARDCVHGLGAEHERQLRADLEFAFRLLIEIGDPDPIIALLEVSPVAEAFADVEQRLVELLAAASEVRKRVLARLLGSQLTHKFHTSTADRDGVDLIVRRIGDEILLERSRDDEPQSFARLRFGILLQEVGKGLRAELERDPELRRGVALWLFLDISTRVEALALVEQDELFVHDLGRLVRDDLVTAEPITKERRAELAILGLRKAHGQADYAAAATALQELDERHHETLAVKKSELPIGRARSWLRREKEKRGIMADLRRVVANRVGVTVGDKRQVTLTYPLAMLENLRRDRAWVDGEGVLVFEVLKPLSPAIAQRQGLQLTIPLEPEERLEVDWGVQFRDLGQEPQLLSLSVYGIGVAVIVLPDGTVLAVRAELSEFDKRGVRKMFGTAVSEVRPRPLMVLPGAVHRLRVKLNYAANSGGPVSVSVHLDQELLCKVVSIQRPVSPPRTVSLKPFQALVVHDLVVRGTAPR